MLTECKQPMATLRLFDHEGKDEDLAAWKALVNANDYQETRLGVLGFLKGPKGVPLLVGSFQTVPAICGRLTCTVHLY